MSAIATFLASAVALLIAVFNEPIRACWRGHPDLDVTDTDQPGDEIRLKIRNNGRRQAKDVEVLLSGISRQTGKTHIAVSEFTTANLRWDFLSPKDLDKGNFNKTGIYVTIPPGITRYLFLGRMMHNKVGTFELFTQYKSAGWSNELSAGKYWIELQLGVADYKAKSKLLLLTVPNTQQGGVKVELR